MKKMKKIAITGVHGVGKTWICEKVHNYFDKIDYSKYGISYIDHKENIITYCNIDRYKGNKMIDILYYKGLDVFDIKTMPKSLFLDKEVMIIDIEKYSKWYDGYEYGHDSEGNYCAFMDERTGVIYSVHKAVDEETKQRLYNNPQLIRSICYSNITIINEVFRDVYAKTKKEGQAQTLEQTLATYGKQLYLEHLHQAQGKNIICDRSVLDTFVYYEYFHNIKLMSELMWCHENSNGYDWSIFCPFIYSFGCALRQMSIYDKIYLIEPSTRPIDDDGMRMTDKEEQKKVHKLFVEYMGDLDNVVIVNQEKRDEVVNEIVSLLV